MKKLTKIFLGWLGVFTTPYLIRKWAEDDGFRGDISMLNISDDKSIGVYLLPGPMPYPSKVYQNVFKPLRYDFNIVRTGHQDYDMDTIATAIGNHIAHQGYRKVRLITVGMSDQLLSLLDYVLREKIHRQEVEVLIIDGLPTPDLLAEKPRKLLELTAPGLMSLRILCGWLAEIPFLRINKLWRSPAELIEQVSSISHIYDYADDDIADTIQAVIKNDNAPYNSANADALLDATFNCSANGEMDCRVYYNYFGNHLDFEDNVTVKGYQRVFKGINWQF